MLLPCDETETKRNPSAPIFFYTYLHLFFLWYYAYIQVWWHRQAKLTFCVVSILIIESIESHCSFLESPNIEIILAHLFSMFQKHVHKGNSKHFASPPMINLRIWIEWRQACRVMPLEHRKKWNFTFRSLIWYMDVSLECSNWV